MNVTDLHSSLLTPEWYLHWCWANEALQSYWLDYYRINGVVQCNVNIGDRFTFNRNRRFGVVTKRILHVSQDASVHWYSFEIAGDLCEYDSDQSRDRFIVEKFMFIPTICQLASLHYGIAVQLVSEIAGGVL